MRLHILCDLHLEFGMTEVPSPDADVVILAGDIHLGREGRRWARSQFPETPVVYVLGNHEFYRHSLPELTEALKRETDGSHIHLLENGRTQIGEFTFLGCTLWTDFELRGDRETSMGIAEDIMSDYQIVRNSSANRVLRARDTAQLHAVSAEWLKRELANCDPTHTVIVTHHAPSPKSEAPYHADSLLAPAFASRLDRLIEKSGVPLWIHGHTHYNVDYKIGATRVLTNQHGYPDAICRGFDPALVVEL